MQPLNPSQVLGTRRRSRRGGDPALLERLKSMTPAARAAYVTAYLAVRSGRYAAMPAGEFWAAYRAAIRKANR